MSRSRSPKCISLADWLSFTEHPFSSVSPARFLAIVHTTPLRRKWVSVCTTVRVYCKWRGCLAASAPTRQTSSGTAVHNRRQPPIIFGPSVIRFEAVTVVGLPFNPLKSYKKPERYLTMSAGSNSNFLWILKSSLFFSTSKKLFASFAGHITSSASLQSRNIFFFYVFFPFFKMLFHRNLSA